MRDESAVPAAAYSVSSAAYALLEQAGGTWSLRLTDGAGRPFRSEGQFQHEVVPSAALADTVARLEARRVRWVWDTAAVYPALLERGVRVERAWDLRLCRAILRGALATASSYRTVPADEWDGPAALRSGAGTLFELETPVPRADGAEELGRQLAAVRAAADPSRIRLLLAAESAGALAAAEMRCAGLPWSAGEHERILHDLLGPRVPTGVRPEALERLLGTIRTELDDPGVNPDSPPELLRALRRAGLAVDSTRASDLRRLDHPAIAPLLEYKQLARLLASNGWHWLDTWVSGGRLRPDYLVGGVVTGRWATRGGGAMQLPKQIRGAVVADTGYRLVVADAAQLEPRVLAGMSGDLAMARAGAAGDLYAGVVASGAVPDRDSAKIGVLSALYGASQGAAGRLVPRLARSFPLAIAAVENAARAGEAGEQVTTLLGRTSPSPTAAWRSAQQAASAAEADGSDRRAAAANARDRGRFTRNFVVQGTAAEWALVWLADLRLRLWRLGRGRLEQRPHLVYFLHDEVVVHAPEQLAEAAADAVLEAAASAGRALFGEFPVSFPLDTAVVDRYSDAG